MAKTCLLGVFISFSDRERALPPSTEISELTFVEKTSTVKLFGRMGAARMPFSDSKTLFMYADLKNPFDPVSPRPDCACHERYFPP